ncbi:MAG: DUF1592 domain-containing protein [Deltaproteobacteria bacterium]|nr:DUF1592 domain-containing protein [Deltaproteobacteria bacterium]
MLAAACVAAGQPSRAAEPPSRIRAFVEEHCLDCHEGDTAKAKLDLGTLGLHLGDPKAFETWVKVYDRVRAGEMPPGKGRRPPRAQADSFLVALADPLIATDLARQAEQGRATRRRLNRYEYENALRDVFNAPWLQIKDLLPEDGEAHRFNKVGEALDVSHVQMSQYLSAAEFAMKEIIAAELDPIDGAKPPVTRYYAREQRSMARFPRAESEWHSGSIRNAFPVLGFEGQPDVRARKSPVTVGAADPVKRDLEGVGFVHGTYEPVEPKFEKFKAPRSGRYKLTIMAHSIWLGPREGVDWWHPDFDKISKGRRAEPITLYAERPPTLLRRLGAFDAGVEPQVAEFDVYLLEGETIRPDASRFFRSRPPRSNRKRPHGSEFHNPLGQRDGQPGVSFRWLQVEGPIADDKAIAGRKLLFGDLPVKKLGRDRAEVVTTDPAGDAQKLITAFVQQAYRRPPSEKDLKFFTNFANKTMASGVPFAEAVMATYAAVLCSEPFIYLDEEPGELDDWALASRLSHFLWNSPPDAILRGKAGRKELSRGDELRVQSQRLLDDPRSRRFVDAFLDYWLDLRKVGGTSPDAVLYPDYNLDDHLVESALQEPQLFFAEMLRKDLPASHVVASDFTFANERLARHYGIAPPRGITLGSQLVRLPLPANSQRGGLLTQAAVLKVTANGTTTSPVIRGAWISERLLGMPVPPPPPGVPAIEPDIRGAHTIRDQLAKHRADPLCASCHIKIDPAGFALESFDIFGGLRKTYRAMGDPDVPSEQFGVDGLRYEFHSALPVDSTGQLPDGRPFKDVTMFRTLLLRNERQIARNLVNQLIVFATGAPVTFGDRPAVESILDRARNSRYGVRSLILAAVDSRLFRTK